MLVDFPKLCSGLDSLACESSETQGLAESFVHGSNGERRGKGRARGCERPGGGCRAVMMPPDEAQAAGILAPGGERSKPNSWRAAWSECAGVKGLPLLLIPAVKYVGLWGDRSDAPGWSLRCGMECYR